MLIKIKKEIILQDFEKHPNFFQIDGALLFSSTAYKSMNCTTEGVYFNNSLLKGRARKVIPFGSILVPWEFLNL